MRWVFLLILFSSATQSQPMYSFASKQQAAQFTYLLKELRCLVCQNQDLADSNASLAQDLRNQVYDMVKQGKSDSEILSYLTDRYGDFILFKPPVKSITYLLWMAPIVFLLIGLGVYLWLYSSRKMENALC